MHNQCSNVHTCWTNYLKCISCPHSAPLSVWFSQTRTVNHIHWLADTIAATRWALLRLHHKMSVNYPRTNAFHIHVRTYILSMMSPLLSQSHQRSRARVGCHVWVTVAYCKEWVNYPERRQSRVEGRLAPLSLLTQKAMPASSCGLTAGPLNYPPMIACEDLTNQGSSQFMRMSYIILIRPVLTMILNLTCVHCCKLKSQSLKEILLKVVLSVSQDPYCPLLSGCNTVQRLLLLRALAIIEYSKCRIWIQLCMIKTDRNRNLGLSIPEEKSNTDIKFSIHCLFVCVCKGHSCSLVGSINLSTCIWKDIYILQ